MFLREMNHLKKIHETNIEEEKKKKEKHESGIHVTARKLKRGG